MNNDLKQEISNWVRAAYNTFTPYPFVALDSDYPDDWKTLRLWGEKHVTRLHGEIVHTGEPLPVMAGASDTAIYATPEDNHIFRAWHDYLHIMGDHDFGKDGESAVALLHTSQLRALGAPQKVITAVGHDTFGQFQYTEATGEFVEDQEAFVDACFVIGFLPTLRLVRKGLRF